MLLQAPQSAYRIGCLAAAPPTRIEGRWGEKVPPITKPPAHRIVEPPGGRGAQQRREAVRSLPSRGTGPVPERGARARYTGAGDSHRASEVRSHLTRRRYPYVRSQVPCAPGEKQERQKRKKCSKGLDNYGHIEGLFAADGPSTSSYATNALLPMSVSLMR